MGNVIWPQQFNDMQKHKQTHVGVKRALAGPPHEAVAKDLEPAHAALRPVLHLAQSMGPGAGQRGEGSSHSEGPEGPPCGSSFIMQDCLH